MTTNKDSLGWKRAVYITIIALAGFYFVSGIVANITAGKMISLWGIVVPGGTLVFALTFTLRDAIQRLLGQSISLMIIVTGAALNIFMVGYFYLVLKLPYPVWWPNQSAYETVLGVVPRIVVASIAAMLISETVDTLVYSAWVRKIGKRYLWSRVLVSNAISCPIDSLAFQLIAFAGIFAFNDIVIAVLGQAFFKYVVTVVSVPLIYVTPNVDRPITGEEI